MPIDFWAARKRVVTKDSEDDSTSASEAPTATPQPPQADKLSSPSKDADGLSTRKSARLAKNEVPLNSTPKKAAPKSEVSRNYQEPGEVVAMQYGLEGPIVVFRTYYPAEFKKKVKALKPS